MDATRATWGVLWLIRVQSGHTAEEARANEKRFLDSLRSEAGLIELSFQYGVDFSGIRGDMRLADAAELVRAQQVRSGSFPEIVETQSPATTVAEMGRRFVAERAAHVLGSPAQI